MDTHKTKALRAASEARDRSNAENLFKTLASYVRESKTYRTEDGELVDGILLDSPACDLLVRWWGKGRKPNPRGRRRALPSLFGNPYREEFEEEKRKIISHRKRERGATKEAIAALAVRHRVSFDAMRKRIREK